MTIVFDPTIIAVILGLVEWLKSVGINGRRSGATSMLLGLFLGAGQHVSVNGRPGDFAGWFGVIVVGLAYGLSASGLYDVGKRFSRGRGSSVSG